MASMEQGLLPLSKPGSGSEPNHVSRSQTETKSKPVIFRYRRLRAEYAHQTKHIWKDLKKLRIERDGESSSSLFKTDEQIERTIAQIRERADRSSSDGHSQIGRPRSLFVANLPFELTEADLARHLSDRGVKGLVGVKIGAFHSLFV